MQNSESAKTTWKLTIEYEGTRYYGWQEQKNSRTVAGEIRRVAGEFLGQPVELLGAGRTDAGVHALAQVARLRIAGRIRPVDWQRELNDRLPSDINILKAEDARPDFDPRRDAIARYYLYQISTRRTAFAKKSVWWVRDRLDISAMSDACALLAGRHDFSRFCDKQAEDKSTIVKVQFAEVARDGDLILFRIGASHFLWKMVRRITGALVEAGRGGLKPTEFAKLLDSAMVRRGAAVFDVAAHTAPPSGLFLEKVLYEQDAPPGELVGAFPVKRP